MHRRKVKQNPLHQTEKAYLHEQKQIVSLLTNLNQLSLVESFLDMLFRPAAPVDEIMEKLSDELDSEVLRDFLVNLYFYRKILLQSRFRRIGTKKLDRLLSLDYPDLNEVSEEVTKTVKQYQLHDYQEIYHGIRLMHLCLEWHYKLSPSSLTAQGEGKEEGDIKEDEKEEVKDVKEEKPENEK